MRPNDELQAVDQVVGRLCARFAMLATEDVVDVVRDCHSRLAGNPVRDFVPLLVEHAARDRLRALAPAYPDRTTTNLDAPASRSPLHHAFADGMAWAIL